MATQETQQLDSIIASRRALLMGGLTIGAMAMTSSVASAAIPATLGDTDILNFALNLEYLEAQFYTLATEGVYAESASNTPITGIGAGTAAGGKNTTSTLKTKPNTSGSKTVIAPVPFASAFIAAYAFETALEERKHVNFLRSALGTSAAAQPNLDLYNSFITLGNALTPKVTNFDPFANDAFFLVGAYIFEDVGVSAYHGGAPLLSAANLVPAAKIHAVEAYHAGLIRSTMSGFDNGYIAIPGFTAAVLAAAVPGYTSFTQLTQAISTVRATVDGTQGTSAVDDNGLGLKQVALNTSAATFTSTSILNGDSNYLGRSRTPRQVLNVVYATAGAPTSGGFYPSGLSGTIS